MRIEKLRNEYNVIINLTHFPLHPETPPGGMSLQELFAGRNLNIEEMYARMKSLMQNEGLEYGPRTHTYNSRLAQELGKWADSQSENGIEYRHIHDALYKAYFVSNQNIGNVDILIDVATNAGLPVDEVRKVLLERTFSGSIDQDWARSKQIGVTGVPTFVAKGKGLVGAQPYEALVQLINQ